MAKKTFIVSYLKCDVGMRSAQSFRLREGLCHTVVSHNLRFRATADGVVVENLRRRVYPWDAEVTVKADDWQNMSSGRGGTFRIGCHTTQSAACKRSAWWVRQEGINAATSNDTCGSDIGW